ncbi:MAG TPA: DUF167 domain-containing protein [Phycisphaerae bacterium]|nr:DUF167 domain-containing protein [Phycisphaerae bacterium]
MAGGDAVKIEEKDGAVFLQVKVVPNSSRTQIAGMLGEALKIKVAQPPEEGKANRAVEELLAEVMGVAKGNVSVVAGMTRPQKVVRIVGVSGDEIRRLIGAA